MNWRNRIIERKRMRVGDLAVNKYNPKRHPSYQRQRMEAVLEKFGIVTELVAYYNDAGELALFDGHLRQELDPKQEWDIAVTNLTQVEVDELVFYYDPLAAMIEQDAAMMTALMADLQEVDGILGKMLEELAEDAGVMFKDEIVEAPEAQIDKAAELQEKWGTALGQVWELGDHRLAVGDCTDAATIEVSLNDRQFDLLVTDPPYGVAYADKNRFLNTIAPGNRIQIPIEGDHRKPDEMFAFWCSAFSTIRPLARPGASYYVTGPQGGDLLLTALRDSGFPLRHMLIWAKNNHVLGRSDYNYKHEPIIYGWVDGAGHKFYGNGGETSLWEIPKPHKSDLHPTMKPVELFERAIKNSTMKGERVFDPFAGSGTIGVACERLGRKARMIEVSPAYCGVILERMSGMGLEPRLL